MWMILAAGLAIGGPPRWQWPDGEERRFIAVVARSVPLYPTGIGHPDGTPRQALELELSVILACSPHRATGRVLDLRCAVEDAGILAVPTPEHAGELAAALTHTEGRIESSEIQVVVARNGRLRWVQAMEPDGVLWDEFEGLSSWIARALSPLDVRLVNTQREGPWRIRNPVSARLFSDIGAAGLFSRASWHGDSVVQVGSGRWLGDPRLDIELASDVTWSGDRAMITAAETRVVGRPRRDPDAAPVYRMVARVRSLGDASVRGLVSAKVAELDVSW